MFKTSDFGIPKPPIATTVMVQKQELVSAQLGTPLFREFDHDGLLLDLFGCYDKQDGFEVTDVSITGTRFSVLKLVSESLLVDMSAWCDRRNDENIEAEATQAAIEKQERNISHMYEIGYDLEGSN